VRDSYFYKSLTATLFIYIVLLCTVIGFILATGMTGAGIIVIVILCSLCYFYEVPDKIQKFRKRDS